MAGLFGLAALVGLGGCNSHREESAAPSNSATTADPDGSTNEPPSAGTANTSSGSSTSTIPPARWQLHEHALLVGNPVVYRSGRESEQRTILESLGGGVGVLDFDRDGSADLWFAGGGTIDAPRIEGLPSRLLRGTAGGDSIDVSRSAGIERALHYSHGVAVHDYDQDGFADVLVTGYGGLQLWRNQGDGSFQAIDMERCGLTDTLWSTSAAWGDFNRDGWPDLYVAHYVNWSFSNHPPCAAAHDARQREICSPRKFEALRDACYMNQGDGTFREATDDWGLAPDGKGLGVLVADFNDDQCLDVYVANDTTPNFLLVNQDGGRFVEDGGLSGVALDDQGIPNGSMGVATADLDRNGRLDLWVANYQAETFALYRQTPGGTFLYSSPMYGLKRIEPIYVGFGTVINDIDRDGDDDILVTNGHVLDFPASATRDQPTLALEASERSFTRLDWPEEHPVARARSGRGLALVDRDGDGDADFVFSPSDQPAWTLENQETAGRCLTIDPIGTVSPRSPIGASLTITTDQASWMQTLSGGGSYLSTSDSCFFVVIPEGHRLESLALRWPSGGTQEFTIPSDSRHWTIIEDNEVGYTRPSE
ncbi:MAG: CRTAC1 family protein [Pirellulaceae bacterium]